MAQEQLARNRERARRHNTKHDYLLRGLLVCGHCGRRLVGTWSTLGGRYICSARYPRTTAWACDGRSLSMPRAEQQVWDYIRCLLSDPDLLRQHFEASRGDPAIDGRDERERARLERQIAAAAREVQRLIDAYQNGVIELAELQERRQRSDEHTRFLRQRVDEIEQQRRGREQELRLVQGLEVFCASIQDALVDPSFAVKQQILQLVIDRIVVEDTRIVIKHIIPMEPVGLRPCHRTGRNIRAKARKRVAPPLSVTSLQRLATAAPGRDPTKQQPRNSRVGTISQSSRPWLSKTNSTSPASLWNTSLRSCPTWW